MKTLGKLMWGEKSELVELNGSFYRVPRDQKGQSECLFLHSVAVVKRMSQPHTFTLIVSRVTDDDVAPTDGDEENEMSFFLGPDLRYGSSLDQSGEGEETAFFWQDPTGKESFKFIPAESPTNTRAFLQLFELSVLQSIYEWINKRTPDAADDDELLALKRYFWIFLFPLHTFIPFMTSLRFIPPATHLPPPPPLMLRRPRRRQQLPVEASAQGLQVQ